MVKNIYFDKLLFIIFFSLIITGIVFLYSAVSVGEESEKSSLILRKEIIIITLGILVMTLSYITPIEFWKKFSYISVLITITMLILVFIVSGGSVKRWLDLGFFNFQPSEFAKISIVLFIAYFTHRKKNENLNSWSKLFTVFSIPVFIATLIFFEPHKGAALFILILSILIISSSYYSLPKILTLSIPAFLVFFYFIFHSSYALKRLKAFINPMDGSNSSYQVLQSLLAFAKGGLFGEGIGAGTQKFYYLPEIHTDYILALIGEETGFLGVIFILILFILLLFRGITISLNRNDIFTQILGIGLTYMIVLQALFHILVNIGLFPPTGFTLPFISYGGSSFLINCTAAGILLRISKEPIKSIFTEEDYG